MKSIIRWVAMRLGVSPVWVNLSATKKNSENWRVTLRFSKAWWATDEDVDVARCKVMIAIRNELTDGKGTFTLEEKE